MKVVIIIALYNAEKYLSDLFGSLEMYYLKKDWVRVIAIDDCSSDQTYAMKQSCYPWVNTIQTRQNCGFAAANNEATNYALQTYSPQYLFYLNQDTEVEEGFLEKLVEVMDRDASTGIAQPLILLHPFSDNRVNTTGNRLHFMGYGYTANEGEEWLKIQDQFSSVNDITYAGGAAFMTRSELVRREGLFDSYYVAYQEDTDFSLRIWKSGLRVVLVPASRVAHKYTTPSAATTKKQLSRNIYYWIERSRFILFAKFYTTRMLILFLPSLIVNEVGVMLFSIVRGFWRERLAVYLWLWKDFSTLLKIRRKMKRDQLWEKKLLSLLVAKVQHGSVDTFVIRIANVLWMIYFACVRWILK